MKDKEEDAIEVFLLYLFPNEKGFSVSRSLPQREDHQEDQHDRAIGSVLRCRQTCREANQKDERGRIRFLDTTNDVIISHQKKVKSVVWCVIITHHFSIFAFFPYLVKKNSLSYFLDRE